MRLTPIECFLNFGKINYFGVGFFLCLETAAVFLDALPGGLVASKVRAEIR